MRDLLSKHHDHLPLQAARRVSARRADWSHRQPGIERRFGAQFDAQFDA